MPDGERFAKLRGEYEAAGRAGHYAAARWSGTAHARRTDRRERRIVGAWLARCGPCARILDVPRGAGRFTALLAAHAGRVVSADAAAAMLRSGAPGGGVQASAHALPFRDAAFDLVLCARLLHHFGGAAERRAVLRELARVSRRWLIASHFDRASLQAWRSRLRRRADGRHAIGVAEFRADAAACGWRVRDRAWVARGVSEQTWALLERRDGVA